MTTLQPTWLEADTELTALMGAPPRTPWLLETLARLQSDAQASGTRVQATIELDGRPARVGARVAALTCVPPAEDGPLTLVVFHHAAGQVPAAGDQALRGLVLGYGGAFPPAKWRATRWFIDTPERGLQEIKLQSDEPRHAWFLQCFDVPLPVAGAAEPTHAVV